MRKWKRGLAALLAALVLVSVLPAMAAESGEDDAAPETPVVDGPQEAVESLSLLPLEEKSISVDLTTYLPIELRAVKVAELLAAEIKDADHPNRPLDGTEKVAWSLDGDSYTVYQMDDTVDLEYLGSSGQYTRRPEMIVGSAKQLDAKNVRYRGSVSISGYQDFLVPTLYKQAEDGTRTEVSLKYYDLETYQEPPELYMSVLEKEVRYGEETYLGLRFDEKFTHYQQAGYTVKVYAGDEEAYEAGSALDITGEIWAQTMSEKDAGYLADFTDYEEQYLTIELRDGDKVLGYQTVSVYLSVITPYLSYYGLYEETGNYASYSTRYVWDDTLDIQTYVYTVYEEELTDQAYCLRLEYRTSDGDWIDSSGDAGYSDLLIVDGYYKTKAEAEQAVADGTAKNVTAEALSRPGYKADYSKGVTFSAFYKEDAPEYLGVKVVVKKITTDTPVETPDVPERPGSSDTYFRMKGVKEIPSSKTYVVPGAHDALYGQHYQNILLMDSEADMSALTPEFYTGSEVKVYMGNPPQSQESGKEAKDLSKGALLYSVSAPNKEDSMNYTVTFVQKEENNPSLFVSGANGPKEDDGTIRREVFLDNYYGYSHDIFLANVGGAPLDGLKVTLSDAKNVRLDEYWTVGGEDNDTLAAFDSATSDSYYGELSNVAKVRLVRDGDGAVEGKLTLTYGVGNDTLVFTLTGNAGDPKIITTEIPEGVKYVPYGTMIQNSNTYDWNKVSYTLYRGKLPEGVSLMPNGEIYGAPLENGEFTFTVRMTNSAEYFASSYATYTLVVKDNTDANVEAQTDEGYELQVRIPGTLTSYKDTEFKSAGALSEFVKMWLDGEELELGEDYTVEEGSTKATILAQTLRNTGSGSHTIAMEFRVDGDANKELKKATQNYKKSSGSSSSSSSGSSVSFIRPGSGVSSAQSVQKPEAKTAFTDVPETAWYYPDVNWAYQSDLVLGVGGNRYDPAGEISQAMIVTVLARMSKADLSKFTDVTGTTVAVGQWYTAPALWAWQAGMLADGFDAMPPFARGDIAVMLVKYLDYLAVEYEKPAENVAFPDADEMTPTQNEAFQILCHNGIVKGVGNGYMAPKAATTRSEMVTLLHRMAEYLKNK